LLALQIIEGQNIEGQNIEGKKIESRIDVGEELDILSARHVVHLSKRYQLSTLA
jgi:hypothetical protein